MRQVCFDPTQQCEGMLAWDSEDLRRDLTLQQTAQVTLGNKAPVQASVSSSSK